MNALQRVWHTSRGLQPSCGRGGDNRSWLNRLAVLLAACYLADRSLKLLAVVAFFRRPPPAPPEDWPTVTIIQPITRGLHDIRRALASRVALDYPAAVQHLLVCDAADQENQNVCRSLIAQHPGWQARLLLAPTTSRAIALKIDKMQLALPHATGQVLCFVDDDVSLRPAALRQLVPPLFQPGAGATFGLACYTTWTNTWSSLMSGFVNASALLNYIPLATLTEPYTITGHCFALRREVFEAAGGFGGMAGRMDDDHELARRVRALGLRCVQTPLVYDVDNQLESAAAYQAQIKRWFVFPRQTMLPFLTRRERVITTVASAGIAIPPLVAALALAGRGRTAWGALGACLAAFVAIYAWCERRYLGRITPLARLPLLLAVALATPLQIVAALLADDNIEWRGQRMSVERTKN
ncbi:MAG: glycosyltransferase [Chloroflexales bacterium]|nr:glycosyltransferase [Chloroflexales bacterium]